MSDAARFRSAMEMDPEELDRLLRQKREGFSAKFSALPPELEAAKGDDPLKGMGFGEPTEEQQKRLDEEEALASEMKLRGRAQRIQDLGEDLSYAGLAPTPSGQLTGLAGDILYTGGATGRALLGEEGAATDALIGVGAMALPLIPIGMFRRAAKVLEEYPDSEATKSTKELYRNYQKRVAAKEMTGEEAAKELAPIIEETAKYLRATNKPKQANFWEEMLPPDVLETFRAYPKTQAAQQAKSRMNQLNNQMKKGFISVEKAKAILAKEMPAYAKHAEDQAGDVMGRMRADAERATKSRKRGKPPEPSLQTSEGLDRALKAEQQKAAQETTERQPMQWEKTYYSQGGKVARKLKPNARLELEARRKAWRAGGRKGPEPKLTNEDFVTLEGTAPEYRHERKIREYDEFEEARSDLRKAALPRDPSAELLRARAAKEASDAASLKASEKAAREAFDRRPNFNDAEFSFVSEMGRVDETKLDAAKDFIFRLRRENKVLVKTDDGGFDIMDESGLLGGADMPEVDAAFLKSLKERPKPGAKSGRVKNVRMSPEELRDLRRGQIRAAKPSVSGFESPADRLRYLNKQRLDITRKLEADDGTLQRELRDDLNQVLSEREQLLREGYQPPSGMFQKSFSDFMGDAPSPTRSGLYGPGRQFADEGALMDAAEADMLSMDPGHRDYDSWKSPELRAKERAEALAQAERDAIAKSEAQYAAYERDMLEQAKRQADVAEMLPKDIRRELAELKKVERDYVRQIRRGEGRPAAELEQELVKIARRKNELMNPPNPELPSELERLHRIQESPDFDLDAQEAFEREVREEQAAARGGFVGDEADYFEQVDAMKQQAIRDRQFLEDQMLEQAKRDSFPTMSEREVLENLDEVKRTFKDDPEAMKEIARIEREAESRIAEEIARVTRDAAKQSKLSTEEYLYENLSSEALNAAAKRIE